MKSIYDMFEIDADAENGAGVPLVYPTGDEDRPIRIRVKRAGGGNRMWGERYRALMKPHQHAAEKGTLSQEIQDDISRRLTAETLISGWENVTDRDGNPMDFTVENAIQLFTDLPELHRDIQQFALARENFFRSATQEAAGN